jgi:hypothetical protein
LKSYIGIGESSDWLVEPNDPLVAILGDDGCVLAVKVLRLQIVPETGAAADVESTGGDQFGDDTKRPHEILRCGSQLRTSHTVSIRCNNNAAQTLPERHSRTDLTLQKSAAVPSDTSKPLNRPPTRVLASPLKFLNETLLENYPAN